MSAIDYGVRLSFKPINDTKKIFLFSTLITAIKSNGSGGQSVDAKPGTATAESEQEAMEHAMVYCKLRYPASEGYYSHKVLVDLIPDDLIAYAYQGAVARNKDYTKY
jgi:hypothetical protein